MEEFGVGETAASLGLALYVLACIYFLAPACLAFADFVLTDGLGPMLFSPLSE